MTFSRTCLTRPGQRNGERRRESKPVPQPYTQDCTYQSHVTIYSCCTHHNNTDAPNSVTQHAMCLPLERAVIIPHVGAPISAQNTTKRTNPHETALRTAQATCGVSTTRQRSAHHFYAATSSTTLSAFRVHTRYRHRSRRTRNTPYSPYIRLSAAGPYGKGVVAWDHRHSSLPRVSRCHDSLPSYSDCNRANRHLHDLPPCGRSTWCSVCGSCCRNF